MTKYYASPPKGLPFGKSGEEYIYVNREGVIGICTLESWPILHFKKHQYIDDVVLNFWICRQEITEVALPEKIELL